MTFPSRRLRSRRLVQAACFVLAGCGGGTDAEPQDSAQATAFVQLRGCVVDAHFIPRTGTPVRAVGPDGRLLGHAASDEAGRFVLRLPAGTRAALAVDLPGGESMSVRVGATELNLETCLADGSA